MKSGSAAKASRKAGHKASHGTHERKAAEKEPEHFGASEAKVQYARDYTKADQAEIDSRIKTVFGRRLSDRELASLVGAPHDATVTLKASWSQSGKKVFSVNIDSREMSAERTIKLNSRGEIVVHNDIFMAFKQGTGLGTKVFGRQVEQAAKLGVTKIETLAAKSHIFNGYYTWARLGYDGKIPARVASKLPAGMKSAKNVSDLMRSPEGRSFWKAHGVQMEMSFDLRAGSTSRKVLSAYVQEKGR